VKLAPLIVLLAAAGCLRPRPPMSDGERTYRAKCSSCHRLYEPSEASREGWSRTLDKMQALKKVTLSQEERAQILQYLSGDEVAAPQSALR
jgi:hypothetical protein